MSVDRAEVERIAVLAKLRLRADEVVRLTGDMNRILEHAKRLRGLDPDGEVAGPEGVTRSGTRPPEAETRDRLLAPILDWAPETAEGFFTVPPPPGVTAEEPAGEDDGT